MRKADIVSLSLAACGVVLIWVYLDSVRLFQELSFEVLIAGAVICASGMVFTYIMLSTRRIHRYTSLLFLFIVSYGLLTLYSFRYDILGGFDVIGEYTIASKSLSTGRWPIEALNIGSLDRAGRYANCLSVTILPTVLSRVTGFDVLPIFKFVLPAIGALAPILLALVVSHVFGDEKLGFLSGVLFAASHLQIFMLSYMFREQIGYFFLLLSMYMFLKLKASKFLAIIPVMGLLLADAGHVVTDLAAFYFFALAFAPFVFPLRGRKPLKTIAREQIASISIFFSYISLMILWMFLSASRLLEQRVGIIDRILSELPKYVPVYINKVLTTGEIFPSTSIGALSIEVSGILRIWYYLAIIIPGVALVYAAIRLSRRPTRAFWVTIGFLVFFTYGGLVLGGAFIPELNSSRIAADPIFASFTAVAFTLIWALKNHGRVRFLAVLTLIFIFLSLPLNMSLIDHDRILHYHSENSMAPENRAPYSYIDYSYLQDATWVTQNIDSEDWISVDLAGFNIAYLADHVNKTYMSFPVYSAQSKFLIVPEYYWESEVWVSAFPPSVHPTQDVGMSQLLQDNRLVYNNGEIMILMRHRAP